jgi:hypothetical protein
MAAKSEGNLGEETGRKKRGHYRQKECPYCHKTVGNLKNHILQKHPSEAGESAPALSKEVLTGEKKASEVVIPGPVDRQYYCVECRAELRKGEKECWNCGNILSWEGIE